MPTGQIIGFSIIGIIFLFLWIFDSALDEAMEKEGKGA